MVLDTDVSPAPTKDGYYVCFAEFERTPDFPQALIKVLGDVARLCEVENWQFTTVKLPKDKILELSEETLQKHVDCESRNPKKKQHKDVMEFFRDSALTNVVLEGNTLSLLRRGILHTHEFVSLGDILPTGAVDLSESASGECFRLCNFLGGPYTVHKLGNTLVVENWNTGKFLTLR